MLRAHSAALSPARAGGLDTPEEDELCLVHPPNRATVQQRRSATRYAFVRIQIVTGSPSQAGSWNERTR